MADSSQKILKELSDLTRNLDVLAKEMRGMNKNTASVQEAVAKSVEKKEAAAATPDAGKIIAETKKEQDGMFTKFLESIKKNSEAGNNEIKKAGLEGIKSAGKTLLETKSLKSAAKAGLTGILKSGKDSIIEAVRKKREEKKATKVEGITETGGLKEKEKAKKEEGSAEVKGNSETGIKEKEKKEKKSILEKLNIKKKSKEEKIEAVREKTAGEKVEKKSLLSRIREKISTKEPQKEVTIPNPEKGKTSQEGSATVGSQEKKELPSLKTITTGIIGGNKSEEKTNLKEKAKQIFQKTTLGSTIKNFSDVMKKKKTEDPLSPTTVQQTPETLSAKSKIEKIGAELKAKFRSKKKEAAAKEKKESPENKETKSTPAAEDKSTENKSTEKNDIKGEAKKKEEKDKSPEITAQDIADIKSLLVSINSTLNGPLNVKDNKPYRPHSNMLG